MPPSSMLAGGLDVPHASSAVADVAKDHDAEAVSLGPMGTRQAAIAQRVRMRPSTATPLIFVDEAGPYGDWIAWYLTQQGRRCWVVVPSLLPTKAGHRPSAAHRPSVADHRHGQARPSARGPAAPASP